MSASDHNQPKLRRSDAQGDERHFVELHAPSSRCAVDNLAELRLRHGHVCWSLHLEYMGWLSRRTKDNGETAARNSGQAGHGGSPALQSLFAARTNSSRKCPNVTLVLSTGLSPFGESACIHEPAFDSEPALLHDNLPRDVLSC